MWFPILGFQSCCCRCLFGVVFNLLWPCVVCVFRLFAIVCGRLWLFVDVCRCLLLVVVVCGSVVCVSVCCCSCVLCVGFVVCGW